MSQVQKYSWLIETILRAREITLKDINEKWILTDMSGGLPLQRQTFYRWKNEIVELFGVIIECNLKEGNKYYIQNPEVLEDGAFIKWLMDTFCTVNAISQNISIKNRIIVEDIPSSHHYLRIVLDAIKENKVIDITYKGFNSENPYTFPVEPFCLKMFQKRWYLLAHSINDNFIRLYGIDRIEKMNCRDQKFTLPQDFDAKEYFSSFFGVVLDTNIPEERVVLRADKYHKNYMRTLPMHHSQKEIYSCDNYADFEMCLRPTYDFCMELLKYGDMIEVIEPRSLREKMQSWVRGLWKIYKNG